MKSTTGDTPGSARPPTAGPGRAQPASGTPRRRAIITSALPYANGEIHLGHVASTYLPADVTCRYLRMAGTEAYYVCASDDFGTPILIQSEKEGVTPREYVSRWNRRDREDFEAFGIRFDYFSQTSSERNVEFVQDVFAKLDEAGHIFEQDVVQFYCEYDSKFLPDRYVRGTCPYCGAPDQYSDLCEACGRVPEEISDPKCSICGAAPTKRRSSHAFFRLSSFAGPLSSWLEGNENLQADVKRYVQNWITSGLSDWDITRDIPWGVPVPPRRDGDGAPRVFYGWFDNHLAYISSAMEFLESKGMNGKEFWNSADIYHFIGKDIVYHHYLFLPAMRLGINSEFKLPDYVPTRGHLTLQSRKISKSRNWYIGLREFLQHFRADYLRYYLVAINPYSQDDLNFDWDEFAARINAELIGNLGNLVNRALGFTAKKFDGVVPEPGPFDDMDEEAASRIAGLAAETGALMDQNHLDRALKKIMAFSSHFNQYFQHKEPWKAVPKQGSEGAAATAAGNMQSAQTCMYLSINAVRSIAVTVCPFLPESAVRIWGQLGLDGSPEDSAWGGASDILIKPGHRLGSVSPLFARVEDDEIKRHKEQLGRFDDGGDGGDGDGDDDDNNSSTTDSGGNRGSKDGNHSREPQ